MMGADMKHNQKGQALIELIIFLPLMFMFYSMIAGFANAINGSINQQKITRAYFYYKVQNNSMIPKPDGPNGGETYKKWRTFGMYFTGWKDHFEGAGGEEETGQRPVAPCYKLTVPLSANSDDKCDEKYTKATTQYIRVQTVYGVCGGTFNTVNGGGLLLDFSSADWNVLIGREGCTLTN